MKRTHEPCPLTPGQLADGIPAAVERLTQAETPDEYQRLAADPANDPRRLLARLLELRPRFVRSALSAGISYADASRTYGAVVAAAERAVAGAERYAIYKFTETGQERAGQLWDRAAWGCPPEDGWGASCDARNRRLIARLRELLRGPVAELGEMARVVLGGPTAGDDSGDKNSPVLPLMVGHDAAWRLAGVSRSAWFRAVSKGEVKAVQTDSGPRFRRADIERWVANRPVRRRSRKAG